MTDIACSFFYTDDRYKLLADIAISSFKTFHPDIDVVIFDKTNIDQEMVLDYSAGYCKFYYAGTLFDKGYKKVISLGVDTITCGRLDEFINNSEDVLTALDFKYPITFNHIHIPDTKHVNADVICFNKKEIIDEILNLMQNYTNNYLEQGALNQVIIIENNKYTSKIVDDVNEPVVYNNRIYINSKNQIVQQIFPYKFTVENNKLISLTGKIIKIIHLVRGFGALEKTKFIDEVNICKRKIFNDVTKNYLITVCGINSSWFTTMMIEDDWPKDLNILSAKTTLHFPSGRKLKFIDNETSIKQYLSEKLKK